MNHRLGMGEEEGGELISLEREKEELVSIKIS
jgi:hypothetical protein